MADSLVVGQVDGCDRVGGEADRVAAIGREWPDCEAFAAEGLRDFPQPAAEADIGLGRGDGTDDLVIVVFDLRQPFRHGARAWPITAGRRLLTERLVRTIEIVAVAPAIEGALHGGEIAEAFQREHLGFERAVEALVLAAALRVPRPAVDDAHAELEQPDAELGPGLLQRVTPRSAIIDEHGLRQAVAAEGRLQMPLNGRALRSEEHT